MMHGPINIKNYIYSEHEVTPPLKLNYKIKAIIEAILTL